MDRAQVHDAALAMIGKNLSCPLDIDAELGLPYAGGNMPVRSGVDIGVHTQSGLGPLAGLLS